MSELGVQLCRIFGSGQRQLSAGDQRKFDSYYTRWQDYQQRNEIASMEERMQDLVERHKTPLTVPYHAIATQKRR